MEDGEEQRGWLADGEFLAAYQIEPSGPFVIHGPYPLSASAIFGVRRSLGGSEAASATRCCNGRYGAVTFELMQLTLYVLYSTM